MAISRARCSRCRHGDGHGERDQGQRGGDPGPGGHGGVHARLLEVGDVGAGRAGQPPARRTSTMVGDPAGLGRVVADQDHAAAGRDEGLGDAASTARALAASSAEVGSSSSRTSGRAARARARHSRWASPPDSPAVARVSIAAGRLTCPAAPAAWSCPGRAAGAQLVQDLAGQQDRRLADQGDPAAQREYVEVGQRPGRAGRPGRCRVLPAGSAAAAAWSCPPRTAR